jgi:hypothetical protein
MKDQPPIFLTDTNIHSDTQAEPQKLSSLTLYIDLLQEGKENIIVYKSVILTAEIIVDF